MLTGQASQNLNSSERPPSQKHKVKSNRERYTMPTSGFYTCTSAHTCAHTCILHIHNNKQANRFQKLKVVLEHLAIPTHRNMKDLRTVAKQQHHAASHNEEERMAHKLVGFEKELAA